MQKSFHLFSGNWCPMCLAALPEILSTFKELNISKSDIYFYDVNNTKSEPREDIEKFQIKRVPTLVVLDDKDLEVGRITEYYSKSWNEDIKSIVAI